MYPELFKIPFIDLTVKSYGLMMVAGFLAAVFLIRYLSRDITPDAKHITNAALYALLAGVAGARLFHVVHYFENYKGDLLSVFAVWNGGLELVGGVILAIAVIIIYIRYHKLPLRKYLDILAIALMLALAIGRTGCFLNGCCYGRPSSVSWAVRFPYGSFAYTSQVQPDAARSRSEPYMQLPKEYFNTYYYGDGSTREFLKPITELTEQQIFRLKQNDRFRSLPVHPAQLYSSAYALVICFILFALWKREKSAYGKKQRRLIKPGVTFSIMFVFYGIARFLVEFLRDDNPYEIAQLTISQLTGVFLLLPLGIALFIIFTRLRPGVQDSPRC